jgi:hypothetical protein
LRQKHIPKKRKKPEARAEERKKSQTAVITLSTGTGRDEKGAPTIQAPLVHSGPVLED